MSPFNFIDVRISYPLPPSFEWEEYIDTEQELWALFPETEGRRVNFVQIGITARLFAETPDDGSELELDEAYILMPCADRRLRPVRMRAVRLLTLSEYRMAHLTAVKLIGRMGEVMEIMHDVGAYILGGEVLEEVDSRLREGERE